MNQFWDNIINKLMQYAISILGGLLLAVETSFNFFIPCLILVLLDVVSAYFLSRRVHMKYPDKSDGKFNSKYKWRLMGTMLFIWLCVIAANYVDLYIRCADDSIAVRTTVGAFLFYEAWSCLENWSSENDNKFAKVLQRIMVNKAERHLNVPLSDILETPPKEEDNELKKNGD